MRTSCSTFLCTMLQVKSIAEMGAYVSLLEYNGIEGMILLSELSRRRIRSITKLIKVQQMKRCQHLCSVQRCILGMHCRWQCTFAGRIEATRVAMTAAAALELKWRPPNCHCLSCAGNWPAGGAAGACHGAQSGQGEGIH